MNNFIHKTWFYLQNIWCWGWEKKPRNEKIPRLVALPSPSFLVQFVIFKNAFTFGRGCHYALTVTGSWCYVITREWWFRMHFIHAEDFSLSTKSYLMHIAQRSSGASAFFSVPILTFPSVSVVYSVVFLRFFSFFVCYCSKPFQTNVTYNSAERCHLLINGILKMGGELKESSWSKFVHVAI